MAKKGEIDIEIKAEDLGLNLERLAEDVEAEFNAAIKDVTHGAYAKIISEAQEKLNTTGKDYLKGLSFQTVGANSYLITLEGKFSNALESGWAPYDQRNTLLKSTKTVEVGSRAGLPWVRQSQEGNRYASVPMEKKPFSKAAGAQNLGQMLKAVEIENSRGRKQKLTSIFKDPGGKAMQGKVAVVEGVSDLEGLVKYQRTSQTKSGKDRTESLYVKYRTISDKGDGWINPGFEGVDGFSKAEQWLDKEIDTILKHFLS